MDIYKYAMEMEKDGEVLYREMAANTGNTGIRNILIMLADAEVRHYDIFKKMKEAEKEKVEVPDTNILNDVKNIFKKIKKTGELSNLHASQIELYKKAQGIEKKSEEFYLKEADEVKDESQKRAFRKIAKEESKHYLILENIINLIERPQQWLENPEWYHLEEY
ncbi:MAG: ferritin family protein [Deltaproteobacteria bacterium]|nr:ferritin family protein [Deltaproteobacteria bacterium]